MSGLTRSEPGDGRPHGLAATMLRVSLAERTDSGRLMRGRRLLDDQAVGPLRVVRGTVTGEVQGSHPTPYTVTWTVAPLVADVERRRRELPSDHPQRAMRLVPGTNDLRSTCSCVDASTHLDDSACKHAVAALLQFADQVSHDATLLATWRGVALDADEPVDPDDSTFDHRPVAVSEPVPDETPVNSGFVDPLGEMLSFPSERRPRSGRFEIAPLAPPSPDDDVVATVLADAIEWMHDAAPW